MIVLVDVPKGYTKVVTSPGDVEIATLLGWRLVAITENVSTIPGPGITNYVNGSQVTSYAPSTQHSTMQYVLQLDEESSLAIAGRDREEAVKQRFLEQDAMLKYEKIAKDAVATAENARAMYEKTRALLDAAQVRLNEERGARQRLETDLGKIRAAIGDVKFKELVGSTEVERRDESTAAQKKMY